MFIAEHIHFDAIALGLKAFAANRRGARFIHSRASALRRKADLLAPSGQVR